MCVCARVLLLYNNDRISKAIATGSYMEKHWDLTQKTHTHTHSESVENQMVEGRLTATFT